MPKPGGFDAQDASWSADMQAITRRYNWHACRLVEDEDETGEHEMDEDAFGAIAGIARTEWTGLIGE